MDSRHKFSKIGVLALGIFLVGGMSIYGLNTYNVAHSAEDKQAGAQSAQPVFTAGGLCVNFDRREGTLGGKPI